MLRGKPSHQILPKAPCKIDTGGGEGGGRLRWPERESYDSLSQAWSTTSKRRPKFRKRRPNFRKKALELQKWVSLVLAGLGRYWQVLGGKTSVGRDNLCKHALDLMRPFAHNGVAEKHNAHKIHVFDSLTL